MRKEKYIGKTVRSKFDDGPVRRTDDLLVIGYLSHNNDVIVYNERLDGHDGEFYGGEVIMDKYKDRIERLDHCWFIGKDRIRMLGYKELLADLKHEGDSNV